MTRPPAILLTNDDGIDAVGLRALHDALTAVGDVTVVAPAENQSGVARADSETFSVADHPLGVAVDGTPADCVQYGHGGLDTEFDLVVSGCNDSPNLGAHKIDRSGTVSAAIEAAYLGLPGLAFSVYDPAAGGPLTDYDDYALAGEVAVFLAETVLDGAFAGQFDFMTVNVPADPPERRLRVTSPTTHYDVRIDEVGEGVLRAWDHFYDPLDPEVGAEMTDPIGTDRRAVHDEEISVSPLFVGHRAPPVEAFESLAEAFSGRLLE